MEDSKEDYLLSTKKMPASRPARLMFHEMFKILIYLQSSQRQGGSVTTLAQAQRIQTQQIAPIKAAVLVDICLLNNWP